MGRVRLTMIFLRNSLPNCLQSTAKYSVYNSVGGNATFLLNIPPTKEGLFHENDVRRLAEIGERLKKEFAVDLLENARLTADGKEVSAVRSDDYDEYCISDKGKNTAEFIAEWEHPITLGNIVLKENILCGQRVESFTVETKLDGEYSEVFKGTVIGYKRIVPLKSIKAKSVLIRITDSRTEPTISFIGIYEGE